MSNAPWPHPDPSLRPLTPEDLTLFREAFALDQKQGWVNYFPFLYFFGQGSYRKLLFCNTGGSICLFLHKWDKDAQRKPSLDLYMPPFPMKREVLRWAMQLITEFNGEKKGRIVWVDAKDAATLERLGLDMRMRRMGEEYLYDPKTYEDISGSVFRNLRQNLLRVQRLDHLSIEPYTVNDAEECRQLLEIWYDLQRPKLKVLDDTFYTRICLEQADRFKEPDLIGRVIRIDGKIRSFGFGGRMHATMGNFFIGKSDHTVTGLHYFMQYHLMRELSGVELVNNSTDQNEPGLRFAKRMLRPVAMHEIFRVSLLPDGRQGQKYLPGPSSGLCADETPPTFLGNALEGLHEITAADRDMYLMALNSSNQRCHLNYFPWLLAFSSSPNRSILLGMEEGSLCVFLLHHSTARNRLHLYLPPLPMNDGALAASLDRINRYNGNSSGRLWWIDESEAEAVAATKLVSLRPALEEIICSPRIYGEIERGAGSKLHHQLKQAMAAGEITVRPFGLDDIPRCLELLDGWCRERNAKGLTVRNMHALKAALNISSKLPEGDLQGIVVEVDGRLRACALGGRLSGSTACSLLNIADHDIPSLGYYARYAFLKSLEEFEEIIDGDDAGRKELALVKSTLLPARTARILTGKQTPPQEKTTTGAHLDNVLNSLQRLTPENFPVFRRCFDQAGKEAWPTFFPFLCSRAKRGDNGLFWELYRGSVCLYVVEPTEAGPRLNLFMPPFPFRASTLDYALSRMSLCNGNEACRISWIDERERDLLLRTGFTVNIAAREQIFTRQQLLQRVDDLPCPPGTITRPYHATDRDACLKVLDAWLEFFRQHGGRGSGAYYKRYGLQAVMLFPKETLNGEVFEVDGTVRGYCFGGLIRPELASILATVTHPDHEAGIPMLQASFARRSPAKRFNLGDLQIGETGTGDIPPFEPIHRQTMYRARRQHGASRRRAFETRDINTAIFILAARELGLNVQIISASYSCCIISDGVKKLYVYHNTTGITDVATRRMTNHKYLSQNILRDNGVPVPQARQFECGDIETILPYAANRRPVVIKPVKGSNSAGVTIDPQGEAGIRAAVAAITNGRLLVEDFVAGDAYRILIHRSRVLDILRWSPPFVIGNGIDSIHLLVEDKDAYRERCNLTPIAIDLTVLHRQDLAVDSVPASGRKVMLHHLATPSTGEEPVRIPLKTVHSDNLEMFIRAAEASGLPLAGLDFLSPDLGISYRKVRACVNEINSTPHIWPHFVAGQSDDLGAVKAILSGHFELSSSPSRPNGDTR